MAESFGTTDPRQSTSWSDEARDLGRRAIDETTAAAAATRDAVKDNPAATLAIIGGLAFVVGALWMVGRSRQTRPSLLGRLSDLQAELPRPWRT